MEIFSTAVLDTFTKNGLVGAFGMVAVIMVLAYSIAKFIKQPKMGSAIAIIIALILAYIGGKYTGANPEVYKSSSKGIADIAVFAGFGILGGSMMRDYAIISTAWGADLGELKKAGLPGILSLFIGIFFSYIVGAVVAFAFGYTNPIDMATIGGGACTFIVGPVVGEALGASSEVIALSIAAGVIKSVLAMIITPFVAPKIGLNNPTSAMVFGGLIGSTSGVAGGLAATDVKLVPYGAMVATFYTGTGCLLVPTVCYGITNLIF